MKSWKWLGSAGHFICGRNCQFHLCTVVGKYLISTVGELWFDRVVREIHARVSDPKWLAKNIHLMGDEFDSVYMQKFGYEDVGFNRKYETMVFKAGKKCDRKDCGCGMPTLKGHELDFKGYNDPASATKGHMDLCQKWSRKK